MRKLIALLGLLALAAVVAIPAAAQQGDRHDRDRGGKHHGKHHGKKAKCGRLDRDGYESIFDGSRKCFEEWRYAGGRRSRSSATARSRPSPARRTSACSGTRSGPTATSR